MKLKMRKPAYSEIYMYKNIFWFAVLVFIFCPILNNVALQMIYWYSITDIAYSFLTLPIGIAQEALSLFITYAGFSVLALCAVYFGTNARGVTVLAFLSHAVMLISYVVALALWLEGISFEYIVEAFIIVLPDALVMLLVYFIVLIYARKKQTFMNIDRYTFGSSMVKHPFTGAFVIFAASFAVIDAVVEAIGMIVYYTNPRNYYTIPSSFDEILDLILQYVYIFLFAAIGFVIMVLIGFMAQRLKDSGKKKFVALNLKGE